MNKRMLTMVTVLIFSVVALPLSALAMKDMNHGSDMKMTGGMAMSDDMIMLHGDEVDGVTVTAHLMDVKKAMAEHGIAMTHHLMAGFKDASGNPVTGGQAAVKIEKPDGSISGPFSMMAMDGEFGADVNLDQPGMYRFIVGTKLADGQKRTFHLQHELK
ncbi:hypothetical protein [Pelobacter seleniigenes]|uniref:hypothetical protein n=1 Tax=Pelobacter seleniigenes TaxID=407188 RepID=UPI00068E167B|nr:hypothetical protein [Pelobacter seleniigenes]